MQREAFARALAQEDTSDLVTVTREPGAPEEHAHPFGAMELILAGEIQIRIDNDELRDVSRLGPILVEFGSSLLWGKGSQFGSLALAPPCAQGRRVHAFTAHQRADLSGLGAAVSRFRMRRLSALENCLRRARETTSESVPEADSSVAEPGASSVALRAPCVGPDPTHS
ncbi:hypothetical protein AB4156_10085 [Cupriavidus sp. 2MCAB6]|uniref:hypothetical protein n=1 Tax=Cupriavidus sp. 2MCAB6 TaxID=3232981 RepID=UPI003F8F3C03